MADYRIPGPLDASRGNHNVRDGTLQRRPGVTPGFIGGATPGNTSAWDTLVKGVQRIDAVTDAIQVGRERAGAAILKETGHALEEVVKGLIPGLLLMLVTVVATTVIGGAIGAAVGALAFGVGAAPGAVVGADLGFSAGMSILTWLGLGFLAVSIAQGFGEMIGAISVGTTRAWEAPDSPRPRAEIEKAGDEYAHAIALLFKFILMAIVMRLAGPASEALIAQLRKSRLGEGFASWVVKNKEALLQNPKLQAPRPKAVQSEKPVERAVTPSQIKRVTAQKGGEGASQTTKKVGAEKTKTDAAARRDYLNKKFGRTGNLDADINLRGAKDAALQEKFDALASNGHAVGRHGPRVAESALDDRAMFKIDPMSGTTTDFYTGLQHQASKNATQFTSRQAMVDAESFARNSPDFATAMNDAIAQGNNRFAVKGLSLEDALGPDYLSSVYGKSRLGTAASPTGTSVIDFTGGTYRSVFKLGPDGAWDLYTMFPEPL